MQTPQMNHGAARLALSSRFQSACLPLANSRLEKKLGAVYGDLPRVAGREFRARFSLLPLTDFDRTRKLIKKREDHDVRVAAE
jgi:hypothetical protein